MTKKLFIWAGRTFLIIAVLIVGLTYSGFCFKQFRYISDDEKVRIAIEYVLKENRETVKQYKERAVVYPYKDADELLASKLSDCSASGNLQGGMDWLDKLLGNLSSYVTLEFMGVYKDKPKKALLLIAITNCGDVWDPVD